MTKFLYLLGRKIPWPEEVILTGLPDLLINMPKLLLLKLLLSNQIEKLQKQVFKSIIGNKWYEKLRGYEADEKEFATKSIGQQYALKMVL